MQKLQTTTPDELGRTHIVYTNSDTGVGGMSPDPKDGHTHEMIYDPPRPPTEEIPEQIDPMTGQVLQPGQPADPGKEVGEWIIRPAEDGHTHELAEYQTNIKQTKSTDKEIIDECMELWREAVALEADSMKKGKEAEAFRKGDQWPDAVRRELESIDRAALTINEIGPAIDRLIGYQMDQRTDFKFLPQEDGDQRIADMLNIIVKKISDQNKFPREETKAFLDACVAGKGVFNVYMDFIKNIEGDIRTERFPWDDCNYGPHEKEDLEDCEYEIKSRMYSLAKLKQIYPKKASEIEASYQTYGSQLPPDKDKSTLSGTNTDYRYAKSTGDLPFTINGTIPLVDVQKKQFRLAQCTRKVYKEITVLFNVEENFFLNADGWEEEDIESARNIPGFQALSQLKPRMRITKFCGQVVLSDENTADLPLHDFYTVPVYGYRQDGEFWGKVEWAKDPQREINKRRSQVMDNINRLGGDIYYSDADVFKTPEEFNKFKRNRSKPGAIFEVNDVDRTPKREEAADLPAGVVQIMQLDQENLQRLMNVITPSGGANESNSLFLEKQKGVLAGNQFFFDNLAFAKQKLGQIYLALIQRYYTPQRLQRLLNSSYSKQKFKVGGQDYSQFSEEEILELLETADLSQYDTIITDTAFTASTRLDIAKTLFELIKQGAEIPPQIALEFVDMPEDVKAKIDEQLQAASQAQAEAQTATSNAEISKSLVATGAYTITPEKAQELGLVPVGQADPLLANPQVDPNNVDINAQDTEYANNLASSLAGP